MSSDVCKHCTSAACLEVCPTGALFRTEFGTVVVQQDVCNGCGYCVPACPYGVIDRRKEDGRAWKCTLCYDRLKDDMTPACAQACPTQSIQFGPLDELREGAASASRCCRPRASRARGSTARTRTTASAAQGSLFLLLDEPEVYGLPPDPVATTRDLGSMWGAAAGAGAALLAGQRAWRSSGPAVSDARRRRFARLLLRPADPQAAGVDVGDPVLLLLRRHGRRIRAVAPRRRDRGDEALARRAWPVALAGVAASPPLLISDLGRPERFLNMLRVFKPTRP